MQDKKISDVALIHTAGSSIKKGTRQVLDCWSDKPDFPSLDLCVDQNLYDDIYTTARLRNSPNIRFHSGHLSSDQFGRVISEGRFFLFLSLMEGYGHYINQARSARAFIITTDVAPMNEWIIPSSGALIRARTGAYGEQILGGTSSKEYALQDVPGLVRCARRFGEYNTGRMSNSSGLSTVALCFVS